MGVGVGVGVGEKYQSASELGWPMYEDQNVTIRDQITLDGSGDRCLLTVCAASANRNEASSRQERFPTAVAEDMEGFAVAVSCTLAEVPLKIVRGISNEVGDRDHSQWQIETALESAAKMVVDQVIGESE